MPNNDFISSVQLQSQVYQTRHTCGRNQLCASTAIDLPGFLDSCYDTMMHLRNLGHF